MPAEPASLPETKGGPEPKVDIQPKKSALKKRRSIEEANQRAVKVRIAETGGAADSEEEAMTARQEKMDPINKSGKSEKVTRKQTFMSTHWPGVSKKPAQKRNSLGIAKLKTKKLLDENEERFLDEVVSRASAPEEDGREELEGGSREESFDPAQSSTVVHNDISEDSEGLNGTKDLPEASAIPQAILDQA